MLTEHTGSRRQPGIVQSIARELVAAGRMDHLRLADHGGAGASRCSRKAKVLEGADANLAELTQQAKVFADRQLPLLKALQVLWLA